ncbi:MAG: DUF4388 domain-containing protein [Myxococcaceae bacterium]|nr:DUF4388 domain-containing protein [Myxococcaceae bacterium]
MDPRYIVDGRGQLSPQDGPATSAMQQRQGIWALAETSPDLMVLVRTPPAGGVIEKKPRVVLAGDCGTFPLSDMIAFLGQSRWSGVLKVNTPAGERTLTLKDGEVRAAHSDSPADRIGEVMVRMGYVSKLQLEQVLQDTPPSRIGKAMVEKNLLQAHDLFKCLTEQVSEIFHTMMLAREGAFVLVDQELDDKPAHTVNVSMQSLLMDSIRKIDEMAHFRKRIPHGRLYVQKKKPSDGTLEPEEDLVLGLINGSRTVLDLGQAAKLSEFDSTRVVYRLLEGGFASVIKEAAVPAAEVVAPRPSPAPQAAPGGFAKPDESARVITVFNTIFREVRNEVARRGRLETFLSQANAAMQANTLTQVPVLFGLTFAEDGALNSDKLHAQYEQMKSQLGTEPLASLRMALSDVMFFLLFQAGELLEQRADEDLARRVKELLATLDNR